MINMSHSVKFATHMSSIILMLLTSQLFGQNPGCSVAPIWLPAWPTWACSEADYTLVFEENFANPTLDQSKWQLQPWGHGSVAGDGSQQHYLLENLVIEDGTAKILAKQQTLTLPIMPWLDDSEIIVDGQPNLRTFNYSSSNIWSRHTFFYGRYEIKCRVPAGKGFWSAFWTFGGGDLIDWHEIDVFEIYGDNIERFTCNLHHNWLGNDQSSCGFGQDVLDFSEWNTFRCDFEFDRVSWYINDILVRSVPRFQTITLQPLDCSTPLPAGNFVTNKAYPTKRMHIIFNLAIQSGVNSPNTSTLFPGTFEIDYIRYYNKTNCCSDLIFNTTEELSLLENHTAYNFICGENIELTGETALDEGLTLHIKAGNCIQLKPNLHFNAHSIFHAEIDPNICTERAKSIKNPLALSTSDLNTPYHRYSLALSPNPFKEKVNVIVHGDHEKVFELTVLNLGGQTLLRKKLTANADYSLNLDRLAQGTYVVVLINEDGTILLREKLIKL